MKPITGYQIIEAETAKALAIAIRLVLEEGWEPHGSPGQVIWLHPADLSMTPKESWWQAVVKRAT